MTNAPRTSTGDEYFNTPEPVMHKTMWGDLFTATQMREYRNQALEEAIEHFNLSSETWEGWEVAAFLKGLVK